MCGGGARNPLLMQRLAELLPQWQVATTDDKGVDGDYMEAMAFAWLAQRHIDGLPSNLPEVTGASVLLHWVCSILKTKFVVPDTATKIEISIQRLKPL